MKLKMKKTLLLAIAVAFVPAILQAGDVPASNLAPPDAAYRKSLDQWKTELTESRKMNWATLAGLFWLKPGDNSFGADSGNAIVFPKGPARAGVFTLQNNGVTIRLLPGAHATINGKPVSESKLQSDSPGPATVVTIGSLQMHVIVRGQRVGIRLKDTESAAIRNFRALEWFPVNLRYRVTAKWIPSDGKKTIDVPTVLGDVEPTPVAGTAVFQINGREIRLTDNGGDPAKGLFFVFTDLTSKAETYPGGRFLDTDPVANGTVVLDFNRAYNPPCSITPYATCPLAPRENRLNLALPVGQKYDRAHGHH